MVTRRCRKIFRAKQEERRLAAAIDRAFARGGCVLIPVFALGKTQEVLAMIWKFRREKLLGDFPLYIGGLSTRMTEIYDERSDGTRRQWPRLQLLAELDPFVLDGQNHRRRVAARRTRLRLSSGMMTPKTLSNIFARRIIENPKHSIFLCRLRRSGFARRYFESRSRGSRLARSG